MKEYLSKKIFGKSKPKTAPAPKKKPEPWKPPPLPPKPQLPAFPQPPSPKALKPATPSPAQNVDHYRRQIFEPITSRTIATNHLSAEVMLKLFGVGGKREIKSCYGDIYKIVNALMDYARILEQVCDEWHLQGFHRALYEIDAEKLREIALKYQKAIGYDYAAAVAKCEANKRKSRKDEDIGGDALELAISRRPRK